MTREQFVRKWRAHMAGVIALGSAGLRKTLTSPLEPQAFGATITDISQTTDTLLGQLYDSLFPVPAPKTNGEPAKSVATKGAMP